MEKRVAIDNEIRGTLKAFGFKIGAIGVAGFEARVIELLGERPRLFALVRPMLNAREALRQQCAVLHKILLEGAGLRDDPKGAAFPHDRSRHRQTHPHGAAAGKRLCDDPPARRGGRNRNQARQLKFSGDRDHGLSQERGHAGQGGGDGEPYLDAHDAAL